jgi:hypothetical protein
MLKHAIEVFTYAQPTMIYWELSAMFVFEIDGLVPPSKGVGGATRRKPSVRTWDQVIRCK